MIDELTIAVAGQDGGKSALSVAVSDGGKSGLSKLLDFLYTINMVSTTDSVC